MRARPVWSLGALLSLAAVACSMPPPPLVDGPPGAVDAAPIDANGSTDSPEEVAALTSEQMANDFGDVTVDQQSGVFQVVVRNGGTAASGALDVTLTGANPADFAIVPTGDTTDCQDATLDVEATCIAQVRFQPSTAGARAATLEITATPGGTVTVDLSGNGLSPGNLEITAGATIDFGTIEIASSSSAQTVTVRNSGGTATAALTVQLGSGYTKGVDSCNGSPLAAGASCSVEVRFAPTVVGATPGQLSVRESDAVGVSASLSGTGSARLQVNKTGSGSIVSTPSGLSCGSGCTTQTASFTQTPVTLTATPAADFAFDAWTGACAGQGATCSATLDAALETASVTFVQLYTLTVTTTGSGTVTSAPPGIDCGTDCSQQYETGTMVTLTAEPGAGNDVYAWTGAASGCAQGATTCTISMTANRSVGVEFRPRYTLTVSPGGSGSGTVTGSGISCPGTCTASIFSGTTVSLSQTPATAGTGSRNIFGGWGGACTGTGACSFTMDGNKTVNATFTLQHQLTVTPAGTGTGTVTSSPGGINCPGTCQAYFNTGSSVTLSETHNATTVWFDGWSGGCPNGSCTMDAPKSVTATFRLMDCSPNTIVCDDATDHYVDCSPTGTIDFEMQCNPAFGCATTAEKCLEVDPSNGLASQLDLASAGPAITFIDGSLINTSTGAVYNGPNDITNQMDTAVVNGIRVFRFSSLTIQGTVTVSGTNPLAIVSDGDVSITALLDVSGNAATNGPGAYAGTCVGATTDSAPPSGGGGGGSRVQSGRAGGAATPYEAGGVPGSQYSQPTIVPLVGGCAGGAGIARSGPAAAKGDGGGGGGAVQIVSRTRVEFTGNGAIDASGGGGMGGYHAVVGDGPGGGGGSGGAILIEAPVVTFDGAGVVLSTKGGGGGGVGDGADGQDGGIGATVAAGGVVGSKPAGGKGGSYTIEATVGANGSSTYNGSGAGGGGGTGEARVNNATGSINLSNGAVLRSYSSVGTIAKRQVP